MKLQNLYFSFLKTTGIVGAIALALCFLTFDASAQPGSGRITPNTGGATKKKTTTTVKKTTTTTKKSTTSSRTTKKVTTTASKTKNFDYYYNLGLAFYNKGDLANAILNYTQAIKINSNSADAFYNRGLAYYDDGNYLLSISDYTKSIQIVPAADAYNNRGLAYEKSGNRTQALNDYRTAIRIKPDYEIAQDNLSRLQNSSSTNNNNNNNSGGSAGSAGSGGGGGSGNVNNDQADTDAEKYAQMADDYYDKRDFDNAMIYYTKSINLAPREAGSYVRRGFIYHYTGEIAKAYRDYEEAVRLDPSLKSEAYIQCMLYSEADDAPATGISTCTKTINEFPGFSLAYYKRGVAYRMQKSYDLSLKDFTKSIELYPKFFNSHVYRALIYSATNKENLALNEYTKAIQAAGANNAKASPSYYSRGLINENMGNLSAAAADYRKAYELDPSNSYAKSKLDAVLRKQKGNY